jgi:hypothetical protein
MFFSKIIFYTCDLHPKLNILNPLNIIFFGQIVKEMSPLLCSPFFENFKTLNFLYDLGFHQVHPMSMYFYRRGYVFVVKKI